METLGKFSGGAEKPEMPLKQPATAAVPEPPDLGSDSAL